MPRRSRGPLSSITGNVGPKEKSRLVSLKVVLKDGAIKNEQFHSSISKLELTSYGILHFRTVMRYGKQPKSVGGMESTVLEKTHEDVACIYGGKGSRHVQDREPHCDT